MRSPKEVAVSHCRIPENRPIRLPYELPSPCEPKVDRSRIDHMVYRDYDRIIGGRGTVCIPVASTADVPSPSDAQIREAWNKLVQGGGQESARTGLTIQDPRYQDYFGLQQGLNYELVPEEEIRELWNQTLQQSNQQIQRQNGQQQMREDEKKMEKLELLLKLAVNSGDMDLAMLLFSSLETKQSNEIARGLLTNMQELQARKRGFTQKMAELKPDDKNAAQEGQKLQAEIGDVSNEISMLQTFLQEVNAHKSEAQQLASNFLKGRHEVGMSIVRNVG